MSPVNTSTPKTAGPEKYNITQAEELKIAFIDMIVVLKGEIEKSHNEFYKIQANSGST